MRKFRVAIGPLAIWSLGLTLLLINVWQSAKRSQETVKTFTYLLEFKALGVGLVWK